MSWLIAIPAWGERCIDLFNRTAMPSIQAALAYAGSPRVRFVVHTDAVPRIGIPTGARVEFFRKPDRVSRYYALSDCHREAIGRAKPGEFVALINADHVVSIEAFAAAEKAMHAGKRIVMMAGTRTLGPTPPIGARSRELLDWSWRHPHPVATDALYGSGMSTSLSMLFFTNADQTEVVARCFHLHPFAFVKQVGLDFSGLTVDEDLADTWPKELIHVVTDADEAALVEQSPEAFRFKLHQKRFGIRDIAFWANGDNGRGSSRATATHRWLFGHRIIVRGTSGDVGDRAVCDAILSIIPEVRAA